MVTIDDDVEVLEELEVHFAMLEDDLQLAKHYIEFTGVEDLMPFKKFVSKDGLLNALNAENHFMVFWIDLNLGFGHEEAGLDAIYYVKDKIPDALIIVVSAHTYLKDRCFEAGATHFFHKGKLSEMKGKTDKIRNLMLEYLENKGLSITVLDFTGIVTHVDNNWVKVKCYKNKKVVEKLFPIKMLKSALKDQLRINTRVKFKAIQRNDEITIKITPDPEQPEDDLDLDSMDLLDSKIWGGEQ